MIAKMGPPSRDGETVLYYDDLAPNRRFLVSFSEGEEDIPEGMIDRLAWIVT